MAAARALSVIACAALLLNPVHAARHWQDSSGQHVLQLPSTPELTPDAAGSPSPLVNFQVSTPVEISLDSQDDHGSVSTQTLMEHDFAWSYGHPFVGDYSPPSCQFNRVTMNLTVTSKGRQFDRLGIMYLGSVEVFRTSTAEPTQDGIIWTYVKEMQQYNSLWREKQKLIFDLGNLINDKYTGVFHAKLTATFSTVPNVAAAPDKILPISKLRIAEDAPSAFRLPEEIARVSHVLPRNVNRAVVSLAACGQAAEEFWYQNVPDALVQTFNATSGLMNGGGSWREVQLLIDGQLAGVAWPYPVIFTGGVNPGLWRPIAGIDAFDLREQEIDITPFLPVLLDEDSHWFEIRVATIHDDGSGQHWVFESRGSNWVVTGKIFLFLDSSDSVTRGTAPIITTPEPQISSTSAITRNGTGANETLFVQTKVNRQISISSTVTSANGTRPATWSQGLDYISRNTIVNFGLDQRNYQVTTLSAAGSSGYGLEAVYPMHVGEAASPPDAQNVSIKAFIARGLKMSVSGPAVFPNGLQPANLTGSKRFMGTSIDTHQSGWATYFADNNTNYTNTSGLTSQYFTFRGLLDGSPRQEVELYSRYAKAVNSSVVEDEERFPS